MPTIPELSFDWSFPHEYEIEPIELPPGPSSVPVFYLPMHQIHDTNGVLIKISPKGSGPWIGMFAFGHDLQRGRPSGIFSCPDEKMVCIVAGDRAYAVDSRDPSTCAIIPCTPILGVRAIPNTQLIVFWNFIQIVALGERGLRWKSEKLCSDDLKIEEVTTRSIKGKGWSAPKRAFVEFELDLATGKERRIGY